MESGWSFKPPAFYIGQGDNRDFTMEVFNEYPCQMQQFCLSSVGDDEQKMMMCSGGPVPQYCDSATPTEAFSNALSITLLNDDIDFSSMGSNLSDFGYIESNLLDIISVNGIKLDYEGWSQICTETDDPRCNSCSETEMELVTTAHEVAQNTMECAIKKLREFEGEDGSIRFLFEIYFDLPLGSNNEDYVYVAEFLASIFAYVNGWSNLAFYQNEDMCISNLTIAQTIPANYGTSPIELCDPFWSQMPNDQVETIIHEWFHAFFLAVDLAYDFDPRYVNLDPLEHLKNADSLKNLVVELCGE